MLVAAWVRIAKRWSRFPNLSYSSSPIYNVYVIRPRRPTRPGRSSPSDVTRVGCTVSGCRNITENRKRRILCDCVGASCRISTRSSYVGIETDAGALRQRGMEATAASGGGIKHYTTRARDVPRGMAPYSPSLKRVLAGACRISRRRNINQKPICISRPAPRRYGDRLQSRFSST